MARDFLGSGGHFGHRRRYLVGTAELVLGAGRHLPGNRIQLATGPHQVLGTALQAAEGFRQEVTQGIGRFGQAPQFILALAGNALGKPALAQLGHIIDQPTDRQNQVAVEQP
ncbi:hypothetical protein PSGE105469_18220 [Pseudomonas gessardii]